MAARPVKPSWSAIAQKSPKVTSPPRDTTAMFPELNGASKGSIREKFNWADDEEDNSNPIVNASFLSTKIEKLEVAVKDQNLVINGLKDELNQTKSETKQSIGDLTEKYSKLHEEHDASRKLVAALQGENAGLRHEISELQAQLSKSLLHTKDEDTESNLDTDSGSTAGSVVLPILNGHSAKSSVAEIVNEIDPVHNAETGNEVDEVSDGSPDVSPSAESNLKPSETLLETNNFPALNPTATTNGWPIFVTPETIKKVDPVPPPKKLTMGVDISKFGKQKPANPPRKTTSASKAPSKNDKVSNSNTIPAITPGEDMRKLTLEERKKLGQGRKATVLIGSTKIGMVPMGMFMQCSELANKHFTENPLTGTISFPEGSMTVKAASAHLEWMNEHTYNKKVWSLQMSRTNPDRENLEIVRAARVMGLHNMYVGHFTRSYCDMIRDGMPSYELMDLIVELAYPENDPIFDCLVFNLVNRRKLGVLKPAELDKFLEKHEILASKIRKTEKPKHSSQRKVGSRGSVRGKQAAST
ncbi:hypothetical protein DM02DRAFT_630397 [Periconia macrospinosa]|uniref:Uncharacterized protein n=1 Tax=Periconia macrospinosa TaxID=97972 RepID=A0A2V1DKB2_9PLEO|nr:hypothetical protein DM02DRAFT_630397 [Periconia macrospinosa]